MDYLFPLVIVLLIERGMPLAMSGYAPQLFPDTRTLYQRYGRLAFPRSALALGAYLSLVAALLSQWPIAQWASIILYVALSISAGIDVWKAREVSA